MSYEQLKSFERQESWELEPKEKENLIEAWLSIAVDNQSKPENLQSITNKELKEWLYKTLMADTASLVVEWELEQCPTLIEPIKNEKDLEQKAKLQMKYIEDVCTKIKEFRKAHPLTKGQSDKYDSWPSEMRKKKSFNCVGGTLLGISLLEKAGLTSFYGIPSSHALNILELSNGEWVYADFTNNKIKGIKPKEVMLGDVRTLKLKEPGITYSYIPLLDNRDAPSSIIGNFHSLEQDVKDKKADPIDKRGAQRLFENYKEKFKKNDFSRLRNTLYPSLATLCETKEMPEEDRRDKRIEKILSLSATSREYVASLDPSQRKNLVKEMRNNATEIRKLLFDDDIDVLKKITPELKKFLQLIVKSTKSVKIKNPDLLRDFVELLFEELFLSR